MSRHEAHAAVLTKLTEFDQRISNRLDLIERRLHVGTEALSFLDGALRQYRDKHRDAQLRLDAAPYRLLARFGADQDLRFPHRKILEHLLQQFDFQEARFREVQFSHLVREARVSKSGAKHYLSLLEAKDYVRSRNDGYRRFLRINEGLVEAEV